MDFVLCFAVDLLFICFPFLVLLRERISFLVHVCSTSSGKEVHNSLCQAVALLC